jgi:hypothetical protein
MVRVVGFRLQKRGICSHNWSSKLLADFVPGSADP